MCLTNWQGQNTAPARKEDQQGSPRTSSLASSSAGAEPSQLNSPAYQGTAAASGKGKLLQPETEEPLQVGQGSRVCSWTPGRQHLLRPAPSGDHLSVPTSQPWPISFPAGITAMPSSSELWGLPRDPLHESKAPTSCWALSGKTPDRPHHSDTNKQKIINKCKKRRQRMAGVFGSSGSQGCPP